jgi:hypothetical protein
MLALDQHNQKLEANDREVCYQVLCGISEPNVLKHMFTDDVVAKFLFFNQEYRHIARKLVEETHK